MSKKKSIKVSYNSGFIIDSENVSNKFLSKIKNLLEPSEKHLLNLGFNLNSFVFEVNNYKARAKNRRIHHKEEFLIIYEGHIYKDDEKEIITQYPIINSLYIFEKLINTLTEEFEKKNLRQDSLYISVKLLPLFKLTYSPYFTDKIKEIKTIMDLNNNDQINQSLILMLRHNHQQFKKLVQIYPSLKTKIKQEGNIEILTHYFKGKDEDYSLVKDFNFSTEVLLHTLSSLSCTENRLHFNLLDQRIFNYINNGLLDCIINQKNNEFLKYTFRHFPICYKIIKLKLNILEF